MLSPTGKLFRERFMNFFIVDDHPLVRSSIVALLSEYFKRASFLQCGSAEEALRYLRQRKPDIVLLDLSLPGMGGFDAIKAIRDHQADTAILILSASDNLHEMQRCLDAGANGFVNKTEDGATMVAAIQMILRGGCYIPSALQTLGPVISQELRQVNSITARQKEVLQLMYEGKRNKEIANILQVSEATIKVHCRDLFQQLGVNSRHSAVQEALRLGLVH
ncbi:MAG: hypothetical protein CO186_08160 [Zetaproteobacteria bacterium CG_4_9_14_3_um_filter_49_83]|nr:MAG: hypothetical protein CO186_08160 [Zetaproteobacteria bacterium CG_4_9_14_3_um_filter_49_83]